MEPGVRTYGRQLTRSFLPESLHRIIYWLRQGECMPLISWRRPWISESYSCPRIIGDVISKCLRFVPWKAKDMTVNRIYSLWSIVCREMPCWSVIRVTRWETNMMTRNSWILFGRWMMLGWWFFMIVPIVGCLWMLQMITIRVWWTWITWLSRRALASRSG